MAILLLASMLSLWIRFYIEIWTIKNNRAKITQWKFDANLALNVESKKTIYWWINNIFVFFAPLNISDLDITIHTDASLTGWGFTDGKTPS